MESKPKVHKAQHLDEGDVSSNIDSENAGLLPGLPDHLAQLCLSKTHPSNLYSVCHSWRRLLYSPSFPPFFSLYAILSSPSDYHQNHHDHDHEKSTSSSIEIFSLDPFSNSWKHLPPPPQPLRFLHTHPSFLSRHFPIQSLAVGSRALVLVAATDRRFLPALPSPLVFLPATGQWLHGPALPDPRRWCVVGSAGESVYVASGVGERYKDEVARSMEKWDLSERVWKWEKKAAIRERFSREALTAVTNKGKLCMVNAAKEGAVYDFECDTWREMPGGMAAGWNGPAAAAKEEEEMYVVDESEGVLSKYNGEEDKWEKVMEALELKGAKQMAAGRGRVCAVCDGGKRIVVVDVTAEPAAVWTVEPPLPLPVVAVQILPRMTCS